MIEKIRTAVLGVKWFFLNFGYIKKKAGMKNICFFYKYLFLIFGYL